MSDEAVSKLNELLEAEHPEAIAEVGGMGACCGCEAQTRSQVYGYLSRAFLYPHPDTVTHLRENAADIRRCLEALGIEPDVAAWQEALAHDLVEAYISAFGHTTSRECPAYEAEYGQADVFQKSETLADIAGFYRAFGVEPRLTDRLDHLSVELEFMQFLALKEVYAGARQHGGGRLALCREAQAHFLEDHLGRWVAALALLLASKNGAAAYAGLAALVARFVAWDMGRYGLPPPPPLPPSQEEATTPACGMCPEPAAAGGTDYEQR